MLVGGDLGFSFLVLVAVAVFSPVIVFLVRRKWRHAVARREEIKRLLVLASEEAARAELEAFTGYLSSEAVSSSRQFQYQCVVCFCPTTTRCAQCKAVRYCSSKCQIIHWRQGHKEECRPFATIQQINNDIGGSVQEVFKEEEWEIYGNSFELERKQSAKPAETVPGEPPFSNSARSPETLCGKNDIATECLAGGKGADSNSKITTSSSPKEFSACTTFSGSSTDVATDKVSGSHNYETLDVSTNIVPDKIETTYANMDRAVSTSSEHSTLVNSVDGFMRSGRLNQIKLDGSDGDAHFVSTSSSGSTVDGPNESSFSEPSTPSSGFWEGIVESNQSRDDLPDDSVSEAGDGNFSLNLARDITPSLPVQDSDAKTIISDGTRRIMKPVDRAALSEVSENTLRSTPSLNSEMSNHMDNETGSDSRKLNSRASQVHPASRSGKHSINSDPSHACSLTSLSSKRSNYMVNGLNDTLHILKSNEVGSLSTGASDAHLSSSSRRHSVSNAKTCKVDDIPLAKSEKVDYAHTAAANSTYFTSYSPNASSGLRTSMRKVVDQFRFSKSSQQCATRQVGVECEIVGRNNNKGLFPYEMFVKLYHWNKVELRPCGLRNCGNSCYANAVLQCLSFTPPLTAYFLQGLHSKSCEKKGWCFTCEFESLIIKAKEGNSPLSPIGILSQLQNIGGHLGNGREEDAHEFLRYAIDAMQSNCLTDAGVKVSGSLGEESTLVGLTFGGYLRSKVKCMKCGGKSERHERMMDLSVEIEGEIGTLEEALRKFTGTEILDGENKYKCTRCKSYEKAKKKLTVSDAPNVLTIVLKRFQSGKFGKLNKAIRFPEILNLAPYMSGTSDKSPIYKLYGVVVHLDINNASFSGHYVCYVKNIQNKWFKIDDSVVKPVELERVLTKGAYMLLYARCSPRAPRLIRNALVPSDPRKSKNLTFKTRSHPPGQSDACEVYPLNVHAFTESFCTSHSSYQLKQPNFEEDSLSDTSSAFSLSHEGSSSTDSTRDSTGTEDFMDQIFGDLGRDWNNLWRNSSDSETSSSSTSSPLYSSHSTLTDLDCSSGGPGTTGSHSNNAESAMDGHGLQARLSSRNGKLEKVEGKGSIPLLHSDTRRSRKLASSTRSRETDSERLGWANRGIISSVSTGGSMRERTE